MSRPRPQDWHGTRSAYNSGCHCERCRAANRAYIEQRRRDAGMAPQKRGITHGTPSGYSHFGCRCDQCTNAQRVAWREQQRRYYARKATA